MSTGSGGAGTSPDSVSVTEQPSVVYWNNMPAPYMVDRFNAFADLGEFRFEVWFSDRTMPGRSWRVDESKWRFRYRYVPSITLWGRRFHFPFLLIASRRPDVLVSGYSTPSWIFGWLFARRLGVKTAFRVLATFDTWTRRHWMKELLKRRLFSRVDAIETPGKDGAAFAMRYGLPASRVFYATHTVDINSLTEQWRIESKRRNTERREAGVSGTVFLYVGRLWRGKGIFTLLDAYRKFLDTSRAEASLLLVGDGQDEREIREYCVRSGLTGVVFAGFRQKAELARHYAMADVFVFPTLGDPYGIVVDEAMACCLPVISTTAAGEIRDRVKDNVNGYLVPPGDSDAMSIFMRSLAEDGNLRKRMGEASRTLVEHHTPEQWARDFSLMVRSMMDLPPQGRRRRR